MQLKLLHLNIEGGRVIDKVIAFIQEHDIAIVQLQEVNGGSLSVTKKDNFLELKESLGYLGEQTISTHLKDDPSSYLSNATLFKSDFVLRKKEIIWLKEFSELERFDQSDIEGIKRFPRNALALLFEINKQPIWFVNAHLAWGPDQYDEPHKVEQGKILVNYLESLDNPFVLSGDFNVDKTSKIVEAIDTLAVNHTTQAGVTNTLNPHLHRATHLFPKGLAVDFLYTSPSLLASAFKVIETPDLSDHLGLTITLDI